MPGITPNLLLIDADVAAQERVSAMLAEFSEHVMVASDCAAAERILSENLIDLIVFNQSVVARGQRADDVIASFTTSRGTMMSRSCSSANHNGLECH